MNQLDPLPLFPVPHLRCGGTRNKDAAPFLRNTEERSGNTTESAPDLPQWVIEAQERAASRKALRAFLKVRRDAGLQERHRTRLQRATTSGLAGTTFHPGRHVRGQQDR